MAKGKPSTRSTVKAALKAWKVPPTRLQYGALCYRRTGKGKIRVMLITSRRTRRWISPKGWPINGLRPAETAAREAWEEAGVRGRVAAHSIGFYPYQKYIGRGRSVTCLVQLFPLEVTARAEKFPEAGERKVRWFKPAKAAKRVREPQLARLIRDLPELLEQRADREAAEP